MISQICFLPSIVYVNYVYSFICSCTKFHEPISASFIPGSEPGKGGNDKIKIDQPTAAITVDYFDKHQTNSHFSPAEYL